MGHGDGRPERCGEFGAGAARDGADGEAKQAGRRCIATTAGGCAVDATLQADDALKVVAVTSGENVQEWKNGHCLLGLIDEQALERGRPDHAARTYVLIKALSNKICLINTLGTLDIHE
jgi:hypothetical protein